MEDYFKESRKRLEEIQEGQKREKFLRWVSSNIKYLRKLSPDEVQLLKFYYENVESWKKVVDSTFNMAINNLNSPIDYSGDLDKNRKQADIALEKLNDYIKFLEQKYEINQTAELFQDDELKR